VKNTTSTPRWDVLGLGVVAVDDLLYVDAYPPAESKVHVRRRQRQCGGQTGTALVAAARLGARTGYAGVLGDDPLSNTVKECFRAEGIDLGPHVFRDDARPFHSTIVVDETRHTRTVFACQEGAVGADPSLPPAEVIRAARVLLVDHHGLEGTLRAMRIAREAEVRIVADFERDPGPSFAEVLDLVDHLIVPRRFALSLTGATEPAAAAQKLWASRRRVVVVTCGREGAWYVDGSSATPLLCPAFPVEVRDTTGCGDVFHGAYAVGLAQGLDLPRRLRLASATAALKATHRGGQAGIPSRQTVERFLREA